MNPKSPSPRNPLRSLQAGTLALVSLCALPASYAAEQQSTQPNIVLFLVDDMGLMDSSVSFLTDADGKPATHRLNKFYRTPHMEKLAASGTRFSTFYAHSVCSPTRASILTGQNSARHRTTNWVKSEENNRGDHGPADWNWVGADKDTVVLPRLLQEAGYTTIHSGKAHFAPFDAFAEDPKNLGFDVNIAGCSYGQPGSYYGKDGYGHLTKKGKRRAVPGLEQYHGTDTFLTDAITLEANKHIEIAVKEEKPFFLYMSHYAVHSPFQSDPRYAGNYDKSGKGKGAKAYATMIEGMDKSLGDIRAKLEDLKVADNTLIIFLGDNGSDAPFGGATHGYTSSAPLRGKKATHYEGGMRVPFIAAWAKADQQNKSQQKLPIATGTIQAQVGTIMDLLPTICNLAEVKLTEKMNLDGYDLKAQLAGEKHPSRKEDFLNHYPHQHRSSYFTSYVNGDWKVIYHYPVPAVAKKRKKGPNPAEQKQHELYNLKEDPYEKSNLAKSHPKELKTMIAAMIKDLEAKNALYPEVEGKPMPPVLAP